MKENLEENKMFSLGCEAGIDIAKDRIISHLPDDCSTMTKSEVINIIEIALNFKGSYQ